MEGFGQLLLLLFPNCNDVRCSRCNMFGGRNSWPAQPVRLPEARCHPRWNCFQRLCELLGFCGGAVASDRWLPKSRQHCTKKQYGRKESTFTSSRLRVHVGAQQTSIELLWGRQDIRGRQKGEWDAHRTLSHLVWWMQVLVVLSVFGCLKFNWWHQISRVEIRHDMTWHRELHANGQRAGTTDPWLCVFIPSEAPSGQVYN